MGGGNRGKFNYHNSQKRRYANAQSFNNQSSNRYPNKTKQNQKLI